MDKFKYYPPEKQSALPHFTQQYHTATSPGNGTAFSETWRMVPAGVYSDVPRVSEMKNPEPAASRIGRLCRFRILDKCFQYAPLHNASQLRSSKCHAATTFKMHCGYDLQNLLRPQPSKCVADTITYPRSTSRSHLQGAACRHARPISFLMASILASSCS